MTRRTITTRRAQSAPGELDKARAHAWQRNDERQHGDTETITDHRLERELAEAFTAGQIGLPF
jgi:hypothetical protein